MLSEGKTPLDAVIILDLPADKVLAIYQDYWALKHMHKKCRSTIKLNNPLPSFLKLYRILSAQGMGEQEIINVLKLANNNDLPYMQEKRQFGYQTFFMPPVIGHNSLENEMGCELQVASRE